MDLTSLDAVLVSGGDERIALNAFGLNRYGYESRPQPAEASFGSSTASTISPVAREATAALYARLNEALKSRSPAEVYAFELARLRQRFVALCGLQDYAGTEVIFAASGTDIHLYAAELMAASGDAPLLSITVEASETGSGVGTALKGCHFMSYTACGDVVTPGHALRPSSRAEQISVAARDQFGRLRAEAEIEVEIDRQMVRAVAKGWRVLLVVADVSKTGLISPGIASVMRLKSRWRDKLEVMIDACQFRISNATLRAYLELGFPVAVTGSKFLGGPAFSGALLCPPCLAALWREANLSPALGAYMAPAEWPGGWALSRHFGSLSNFGLLLRWEAALCELAAFRALPEAKIRQVMAGFVEAVLARLQNSAGLELVDHRPLDRSALNIHEKGMGGWDEIPTIFPILMGSAEKGYFSAPASEEIYHQLAQGKGVGYAMRLGQPVACGLRFGQKVSALRLCFSARLAVEAAQSPEALKAVIARGLAVLDHMAALADEYQKRRAV